MSDRQQLQKPQRTSSTGSQNHSTQTPRERTQVDLTTQQRRLDQFVGGGHDLDPELLTSPDEAKQGGALTAGRFSPRPPSPRRSEARRVHRGPAKNEPQPNQTMLFEPEELAVDAHLPAENDSGFAEIRDYINDVMAAYGTIGTFFDKGLQQFGLKMMFGESQAEESGALSKLLGGLLRMALDKAIATVPGLPEIVSLLTEASEHLASATAETPAGANARLADWLAAVGGQAVAAHERLKLSIAPRLREVLRERLAKEEGEANPQIVLGAKARLLKTLDEHRKSTLQRAKGLSPEFFADRIAAVWIRSPGGGGSGSAETKGSLGRLSNGCIRIWVEAAENDLVEATVHGKGHTSFQVVRASLHTNSHQGQAAKLVREALQSGRKSLWSFGVPIKVMVKLPNSMPGGRSWHQSDFAKPHEPLGPGPSSERASVLWAAFLRDRKVWDSMNEAAAARLEGNG